VTGPVLKSRYWRPAQAVRARHPIIGMVARAFRDRVQVELILHVEPTPGRSCTTGTPAAVCMSRSSSTESPRCHSQRTRMTYLLDEEGLRTLEGILTKAAKAKMEKPGPKDE
jgi:hypothetical protein